MPVVMHTRTCGTPELYAEIASRVSEDPEAVLSQNRALLHRDDDQEEL